MTLTNAGDSDIISAVQDFALRDKASNASTLSGVVSSIFAARVGTTREVAIIEV